MVACRGTPFRVRGGSWDGSSSMGDCRKCQTSTASPAKPGGLPVMLDKQTMTSAGKVRELKRAIDTIFRPDQRYDSRDGPSGYSRPCIHRWPLCGQVPNILEVNPFRIVRISRLALEI